MTFELIDITDEYVITRIFYDYTVISDEDRATIVGARNDSISLSQTVELHREAGGNIIE